MPSLQGRPIIEFPLGGSLGKSDVENRTEDLNGTREGSKYVSGFTREGDERWDAPSTPSSHEQVGSG
jgi:hypothetical protein